eukprot:6211144-Pleurochrysis_carterae.AAC.1
MGRHSSCVMEYGGAPREIDAKHRSACPMLEADSRLHGKFCCYLGSLHVHITVSRYNAATALS